jgi:hypothetical protein
MKLFDDEKYEHLEQALKAAYHDRDVPELSLRWRQDVMRDIRRLGPLKAMFKPLTFVHQFVWRFAAVACLVVLMLLGYMWYGGFNPIENVTDRFRDDPVQLTIVQVFEEF